MVRLRGAVTQQFARKDTGRYSVLDAYLAVDHNPAVTVGTLDPPPVAVRQVVRDLDRPPGIIRRNKNTRSDRITIVGINSRTLINM